MNDFQPDPAAQLAACREELLRIEREAKREAYLDVLANSLGEDSPLSYAIDDSLTAHFIKKRLKELDNQQTT